MAQRFATEAIDINRGFVDAMRWQVFDEVWSENSWVDFTSRIALRDGWTLDKANGFLLYLKKVIC